MQISNKELKDILKRVEKGLTKLGKKDSLSALSTVQLKSSSEGVEITAHNNIDDYTPVSSISVNTGISSDHEGEIYLKKQDIAKIKKLKGDFDIDFKENTIKSGAFKIEKTRIFEPYEIEIKNLKESPVILSDEIKDNIHHVINVSDIKNPKWELNGVLLENKGNNLNIVATDTRMLSILNDDLKHEDFEVIPHKIPLENVNFKDVDFMLISENHLVIKEKNITHTIGIIKGKFPMYERIIPHENKVHIDLNKNDFNAAVKECNIFGHDITFENDEFTVYDDEENKIFYKHDFDFSDVNFTCNTALLNKALTGDEKLSIEFNDSNIPFTVNSGALKSVIMPIVF